MAEQFIKFLKKSPHRKRILAAIKAIYDDNFSGYNHKALAGKKDHYRIRIGGVRIIYIKTQAGNKILRIGNRGDVYKDI